MVSESVIKCYGSRRNVGRRRSIFMRRQQQSARIGAQPPSPIDRHPASQPQPASQPRTRAARRWEALATLGTAPPSRPALSTRARGPPATRRPSSRVARCGRVFARAHPVVSFIGQKRALSDSGVTVQRVDVQHLHRWWQCHGADGALPLSGGRRHGQPAAARNVRELGEAFHGQQCVRGIFLPDRVLRALGRTYR